MQGDPSFSTAISGKGLSVEDLSTPYALKIFTYVENHLSPRAAQK